MHFLQKLSESQLKHTRRFVAKDIVVTRLSYRAYRLHYVAICGLIEFCRVYPKMEVTVSSPCYGSRVNAYELIHYKTQRDVHFGSDYTIDSHCLASAEGTEHAVFDEAEIRVGRPIRSMIRFTFERKENGEPRPAPDNFKVLPCIAKPPAPVVPGGTVILFEDEDHRDCVRRYLEVLEEDV
jgi:hypothetical protein